MAASGGITSGTSLRGRAQGSRDETLDARRQKDRRSAKEVASNLARESRLSRNLFTESRDPGAWHQMSSTPGLNRQICGGVSFADSSSAPPIVAFRERADRVLLGRG